MEMIWDNFRWFILKWYRGLRLYGLVFGLVCAGTTLYGNECGVYMLAWLNLMFFILSSISYFVCYRTFFGFDSCWHSCHDLPYSKLNHFYLSLSMVVLLLEQMYVFRVFHLPKNKKTLSNINIGWWIMRANRSIQQYLEC